jgi:pimeloyl-ACP methyl ester carboxylesterase
MSRPSRTQTWILLAVALSCPVGAQRLSDLAIPSPLPPKSTLVIGFLGGYERWDDEHRSVRRLALKLREQNGVFAESIENHNRKIALKLIRRALDVDRNGRLSPEEKAGTRIILYGQSWGGAAAIDTARDLDKLGIPVLLTVQVDSVGVNDGLIPANVRAAVNFYQHDPLTIQGRSQIYAADPTRTAILGNFEESYVRRSVDESDASWPRRVLGGSHNKMELDPAIWNRVEQYINDAISRR